MGVHGLTSILKRYAPNAVRNVSCGAFARQTIAIDASCHLNKFIYGDETHIHRHIFGFYQLARFCDLNLISPIFVFDGPKRLEAKQMEHAKRARARRKVKHSLLFEQEQSARLDNWLEVSDMCDQAMMSKESALSILSELGETLQELEEDIPDINEEEEEDDDIVPMEKQQEIEIKLTQIAQELRIAILNAENTDKYTRTVRDLAFREKELMSNMIISRFKNIKSALQMLRRDNQNMLNSLGKLC
jgi:molybdopterin converting factor small subunit